MRLLALVHHPVGYFDRPIERAAIGVRRHADRRGKELLVSAIALPRGSEWTVVTNGPTSIDLDRRELAIAAGGMERTLEFDARERTYSGHRTIFASGRTVRLEAFDGSRWRLFSRAVQTSSTGLARWSVRFPRGRFVVRARFAGTIDLAAATSSGVSIRVR